ncbi:MAG: hypothetical protein PHI86_06930 [Candidatus Omnitrophica bacterium]|nr:hypothetical protein [Candidatus Omnitrophota bacterium]HOX54021.1 hypothetical protein [Candidatus Omnitrophota bacterium]
MDKNISPEEKLLRLIRGRPKKEPDKDSQVSFVSEKKAKINFNFLKPLQIFLKNFLVGVFNFKTLNLTLVVLLIIFSLYAFVVFLTPVKGRMHKLAQAAGENEKQQEIKISKPQNYDYYYKQFSRRDIFTAPLSSDKTDTGVVSSNLKDATKNLKLVGVILGKHPQAIIEDKATKMTHFLNKGDALDKVLVKDILESKVILSSAGEDIELGL